MNPTKRSDEPIFWGLFGAGGMWSAIFAPVMILLVCFLAPLGVLHGSGGLTFYLICTSVLGKIFIFFMIVLPLWCGLHRVHHCLHDLKIHSSIAKYACYSTASVLTVITLFLIISL